VLTLGLYGIFATAAPLNRHQNADNPTPFYSLVVDIQQDHIFYPDYIDDYFYPDHNPLRD